MQMIPVSSSAIAEIGYEPGSRQLDIEFHETGVYSYYNVPPHIYEGIMNASSKGQYFNEYIRDQYGD